METLKFFMNKNLTIIDGTSLIYSACYNKANDPNINNDDFSFYKQALEFYILNILSATNAEEYIIFGDSRSSYRKKLFSEFKGDRVNKPLMQFRYDLTDYAYSTLHFYNHEELEADDLCLLAHNHFKSTYNITIASKDSDLRQYPAKFFNYGIYAKKDAYRIEDAFEEISLEQAQFNLWKSVLTKGHNNKIDYLEGCGDVTSSSYLNGFKVHQYAYAVLKAFIYGIAKDITKDVKRNVNGYGLNKGIDKFQKSFKQTYLFRNVEELKDLGIEIDFPCPNSLEINDPDKIW